MRTLYRLFFLSFLLFTSSCSSKERNLEQIPTLPIDPIPSAIPETPMQEQFIKITQISPTISPSTLEPELATEEIKAFFQTATGCVAPCFMDVVPGNTTLDEAKAIFRHLGIELQYTTSVGSFEFYSFIYKFENRLELSPIFTIQDNIVKNIRIGMVPDFPGKDLNNERLIYSPELLVNQYGRPSRVEFVLGWGPRTFFDMILYFDSYDLVTEYVGYNIIEGTREKPNVCLLAVQYDSVRVWLGKNPPNLPSEGIPLSEATQLDMEEFSNILLGQPENACITFDGEVFP